MLSKLEDELKIAKEECRSLATELSAAEAAKSDSVGETTILNATISKLEVELKAAKEECTGNLQAGVSYSEDEHASDKQHIADLEKRLKIQGYTLDELNEVISGLEAEKNTLKVETDVLISELHQKVQDAHDNHPLHAEMKHTRNEVN